MGQEEKSLSIPYREEDNFPKANILIRAKLKMNLLAQKIFAIGTARIDQALYNPQTGTYYNEFSTTELKKLTNTKGNSFYETLNMASKQLVGTTVGFMSPDSKEFSYFSLISEAKYSNNVLRITYNNTLMPYMKNFSDHFTMLNLPILLSISSQSAFRLYELLKSYAFVPKGVKNSSNSFAKKFLLSELRFELGINDINDKKAKVILENNPTPDWNLAESVLEEVSSYATWTDLKRHVLEPGIKEINEKTDIYVTYTAERGKGRTVQAVDFTIRLKNSDAAEEEIDEVNSEEEKKEVLDKAFELIIENVGIVSSLEILKICEVASFKIKKIEKAITVYNQTKEKNPIPNPVGFLICAIKDNYSPMPEKSKSKGAGSFNSMPKRDYDFEELERILIVN